MVLSRILHFATHALVDENDLMTSRLFFFPESNTEEDGILNAHEIYQLSLNSPLIVLSACQTGTGPMVRGEGIMSLARAFQYAGSQRVLTSLWQIDDRAAAFLSTAFFQDLVNGASSEIALQAARKKWLEQSDNYHCHPYFWSGYVLIGDGGIVFRSKAGKWTGILASITGILLLLGGLGWQQRKRRQHRSP